MDVDNDDDDDNYFAPGRVRSIALSMSVCLSARRSHISKTTRPNFTKFSVHTRAFGPKRP